MTEHTGLVRWPKRKADTCKPNRIDRLEEKGLVRRIPDPEDRRGILVELTKQGQELIDTALIAHVANEERILKVLSKEEQHTLATLLSKLLSSLEHPSSQASSPSS